MHIVKQLGVAALFAAGVAWGTVKATVDQKVDRVTYDADKASAAAVDSAILAEIRANRADTKKIVAYLCKRDPTMLGCE